MDKKNTTRRAALIGLFFIIAMVGSFLTGRATADQPHMHAALDALKVAQRELAEANADKGGHRAKAEEHVKSAIAEVEKGIEFERGH
jgi:hypothetical protein